MVRLLPVGRLSSPGIDSSGSGFDAAAGILAVRVEGPLSAHGNSSVSDDVRRRDACFRFDEFLGSFRVEVVSDLRRQRRNWLVGERGRRLSVRNALRGWQMPW